MLICSLWRLHLPPPTPQIVFSDDNKLLFLFISIEILDRLWDFVNDEPEGNDEEDGEGEPLAVKR